MNIEEQDYFLRSRILGDVIEAIEVGLFLEGDNIRLFIEYLVEAYDLLNDTNITFVDKAKLFEKLSIKEEYNEIFGIETILAPPELLKALIAQEEGLIENKPSHLTLIKGGLNGKEKTIGKKPNPTLVTTNTE